MAEGLKWTEAKEDQRIERGVGISNVCTCLPPCEASGTPCTPRSTLHTPLIKVSFDFRLSNCFWTLLCVEGLQGGANL